MEKKPSGITEFADGILYNTPEGGTLCYYEEVDGTSYKIHRFAERQAGVVTQYNAYGEIIDKHLYH